jgi:hypothetical protein
LTDADRGVANRIQLFGPELDAQLIGYTKQAVALAESSGGHSDEL